MKVSSSVFLPMIITRLSTTSAQVLFVTNGGAFYLRGREPYLLSAGSHPRHPTARNSVLVACAGDAST